MNANRINFFYTLITALLGCILCVNWNVVVAEEVADCELRNLSVVYKRPKSAPDVCPSNETVLNRSYILCVPPRLKTDPKPLPLVLVFHGAGGSADTFKGRVQFEVSGVKAVKKEFITAYPNGCEQVEISDQNNPPQLIRIVSCNGGNWNGQPASQPRGISERCKIDDVGFIDKIIEDIKLHYPVTQTFAFGHSKGGIFAYTLACDRPAVFSAIGVTASTLTDATCALPDGVSIFHVHNLQDENVPFGGGGDNNWPSARAGLQFWAAKNRCTLPIDEHDFDKDKCLEAVCQTALNLELCLISSPGFEDFDAHNYNTYDAAFKAHNKKHKTIREGFVERYLQ